MKPTMWQVSITLLFWYSRIIGTQGQSCYFLIDATFGSSTNITPFFVEGSSTSSFGPNDQWQVRTKSYISGKINSKTNISGSALVSKKTDKEAPLRTLCSPTLNPQAMSRSENVNTQGPAVCSLSFLYLLWPARLPKDPNPASLFQVSVLSGSVGMWAVVGNCCTTAHIASVTEVTLPFTATDQFKVTFHHMDTTGIGLLLLDNISVTCCQEASTQATIMPTFISSSTPTGDTTATTTTPKGDNVLVMAVVIAFLACMMVVVAVPLAMKAQARWHQRTGYQLTPTREHNQNAYIERRPIGVTAESGAPSACCGDERTPSVSSVYDLVGPPSLPARHPLAFDHEYGVAATIPSVQLSPADVDTHSQQQSANEYTIDVSPPGHCTGKVPSSTHDSSPFAAATSAAEQPFPDKSKRLSSESHASFDSVTPNRASSETGSAGSRYIYQNTLSPYGSGSRGSDRANMNSSLSEDHARTTGLDARPSSGSGYLRPADLTGQEPEYSIAGHGSSPYESTSAGEPYVAIGNVASEHMDSAVVWGKGTTGKRIVAKPATPSSTIKSLPMARKAVAAATEEGRHTNMRKAQLHGRKALAVIASMPNADKESPARTKSKAGHEAVKEDIPMRGLIGRAQPTTDKENPQAHYEEINRASLPESDRVKRVHWDIR